MADAYAPVRGKCTFWREIPNPEDEYDVRIKAPDKRVNCSCFIEGDVWTYLAREVPSDCPKARHCRYYIKSY